MMRISKNAFISVPARRVYNTRGVCDTALYHHARVHLISADYFVSRYDIDAPRRISFVAAARRINIIRCTLREPSERARFIFIRSRIIRARAVFPRACVRACENRSASSRAAVA